MTAFRRIRFQILVLVLAFLLPAQSFSLAVAVSRKDRFWEKVNVEAIVKAITEDGATSAEECERLVRLNLRHLYFNSLDTDQFVGMPNPKRVAERMAKMLLLRKQLRSLLDDGARLSNQPCSQAEFRHAARRIGKCADEIYGYVTAYLKDAKYYKDKKMFETSLTSIAYCEGLLDALKLMGAIKIEPAK